MNPDQKKHALFGLTVICSHATSEVTPDVAENIDKQPCFQIEYSSPKKVSVQISLTEGAIFMPKTKAQKIEKVADLTQKLGRAKSVVFADYQGLTMNQLSDLRNKLRDIGAELEVTKNTLIKLSLPANYQLPATALEGPTATLFSYEDEIAPIKILVKAFKDAQKGSVKSGLLNNDILDASVINRLANLPTKLELQAKLVGSLSSPLYGLVNVLLRNLVYVLNQIKQKKSAVA